MEKAIDFLSLVNVFYLITGLMLKHYFCDFVFQTKFQLNNKSKYLHPGGIQHSILHASFSFLVFLLLGWFDKIKFMNLLMCITLIDLFFHYHLDYVKEKLNKFFKLTPNRPEYWIVFGLDQLLHQISYLVLVYILLNHQKVLVDFIELNILAVSWLIIVNVRYFIYLVKGDEVHK